MAEFCPYCRRNCNCKACLCRQDMIKSNKDAGQPKNEEERIQQLKYLIYALSPFLKQFDHEQTVEKEMEAKIKGCLGSEVINCHTCIWVSQKKCKNNACGIPYVLLKLRKVLKQTEVQCKGDNCRTSIVDFHCLQGDDETGDN